MYYTKDAVAIAIAEIIYKAASDLTPAQRTAYHIGDPEILALRQAIDDFKTLPSPEQMKDIKKQLTALLSEPFGEGNDILDVIDGLMKEFKISNPDFYSQYFNARPVLESHRRTTIEGSAIDQTRGEDLQNAQVIITSSDDNFDEKTDVQGRFKQQISPETNYSVKFILPDYEPQEFENVKLNSGEHEGLIVKLKKIVP